MIYWKSKYLRTCTSFSLCRISVEVYRYDWEELNIHDCELILKDVDKEIYDKAMARLLLYELEKVRD